MTTLDPTTHDALERRRDITRSRLFRAIDALDRRRHELGEVGGQAKKYAGLLAVGAGALSLAIIIAVVSFSRRSRAIEKPSFERSLIKSGLRRAAISLMMLAANQLGKRAILRFLGADAKEIASR